MKIELSKIKRSSYCLLTLGAWTLMFENRSKAEDFISFLLGTSTGEQKSEDD